MNRNTEQTELIRRLEAENAALKQQLQHTRDELNRITAHRDYLEADYNMIVNSRGHQLLDKYYKLRSNGVAATLKELFSKTPKQEFAEPFACYQQLHFCTRINILTPPHTEYVARLLQGILQKNEIQCSILFEEPKVYEDIPYILLCPMNYKRFPKVYVAFQMEQTVSSRWLTEEYMESLYNAYAVFDYSLVNIAYFSKDPKLAKKLYYLPIDLCKEITLEHSDPVEKEYDILFYGVTAGDHRQAFLQPISEKFNIRIVEELFGDALYAELKKAKLVINIHYYENALLETTRLFEVLSVTDAVIVSERSNDPTEEEKLNGIVDFVPIGNVDAMIGRLEYWLTHETERCEKAAKNRELLLSRPNAAEFYCSRFLLANDRISFDRFYEEVGSYVHIDGDRLCLSLPETTDRRAKFDADNHYGFQVIPGLKHHLGWIGCGLSYKLMFRKALDQGLEQVLICEDDTFFPADFEERLAKLFRYVATHDDWDLYNGIVSDIKDINVLDCNKFENESYVYIDRMIGMVFNLYRKSVYQSIIDWDHTNQDMATNTIDRYLQAKSLKVFTGVPFIVGHKEDLNSTLWDGSNTIYTDYIAESSQTLLAAANAYMQDTESK